MATDLRTPGPGSTASPLKRCPRCAEEIQAAAVKCRYCGSSTKPPTNPLAVWAVLGNLLGVPIGTVIALVCGKRAIAQIDASGGRQGGRGLAQAGIVWAWCAPAIVGMVLLAVLVSRGDRAGSTYAPRPLTPTQQGEMADAQNQLDVYNATMFVVMDGGMSRGLAFDTRCWDSLQDHKAMIYAQVSELQSMSSPSDADIASAGRLAADFADVEDRQWSC